MKPHRPTAAGLALFVSALAVWLVFRSHVTPPAAHDAQAPMAEHATSSPDSARAAVSPSPGAGPKTDATSPVPSATVSASTQRGPAPSSPVPPGVQDSPASAASDPSAVRSDAASLSAIKVRRMVTDYHTLTGENPVGTNAEIMAAVTGKNPRQAVLGPPEGLGVNASGELIDEWGTPYFFHQLSRDVMEIHSAGPDKIMGTADDIMVR